MKLTREVDIFQCPPSTKYCFVPFGALELNTVKITDYVRVWHGEIELDKVPEGVEEIKIQLLTVTSNYTHINFIKFLIRTYKYK